MVSVDKTVMHQSLKDWIKTFRKEPKYLSHVWVYPDRLETTISKDVMIKDIGDVTVYTRYIVPFVNEFETRGDKKITAICLSSGDAVNFLNFLQASNPERVVYDCWPNNSSEWATKRNLSYETVVAKSRVASKKHENFYEYNNYQFEANQIRDINEYREIFGLFRYSKCQTLDEIKA